MYGCLIALDNQPGVHPFGVMKTWTRHFSNIVLKFTGPEVAMSCQDDHMCAGLKAEIDGAVHEVQDIWYQKLTTENWRSLLVEGKKFVQRDQLSQNAADSLSFMAIWSLLCF